MPPEPQEGVSRELGADLAATTVALYTGMETRLATDIARRLAAGLDAPDWAQRKLEALGELRRWARVLVERVGRQAEQEITQAMLLAYMRGGSEAMRTIARLQSTLPEWLRLADVTDPNPRIREALRAKGSELDRKLDQIRLAIPGVDALMHIVRALVLKIQGLTLPVLRWTDDVYRQVIATAALPNVVAGLATRRRAAQVAWERLLSHGVTGFVDRSGRRWELASYVEMAVRTGTSQAAVEGHLDRLSDAGLDLVIVSNAPAECARCRPWEGKVLARTGAPGPRAVRVESAISDELVTVQLAGTVPEAIALGLMHPNCRHSLSAYIPGATRIPTHTADPEGDKARQHLRHLERQVRQWKRVAAAPIDPAAGKAANAKVRAYQARIRDHVKATPGLLRQPHREQIGVAR